MIFPLICYHDHLDHNMVPLAFSYLLDGKFTVLGEGGAKWKTKTKNKKKNTSNEVDSWPTLAYYY
jgi:hypothetical protein